MANDHHDRLVVELQLMEAMYPNQLVWTARARELQFNADSKSLSLRLPEGYLLNELPQVLSAEVGKVDVRQKTKAHVQMQETGEEVLDSILSSFTEFQASDFRGDSLKSVLENEARETRAVSQSKTTIIVWLHHLLNTNKRKQALSPASAEISGLTKPGYPGVLVYSGPKSDVRAYVNELKQLNWQAFQVRLESEEEWTFAHGSGVKEVETMKDAFAEIGPRNKELFMEAMRMK